MGERTKRTGPILGILLPLLLGAFASATPAPQAGGSSRERAGLAEDQALLQRQLARLRQTMETLASRFEAEGRTHAAKLLREGLSHLGERATTQGSKTIDELMGGSRSSLESGQTVQAVEVQAAIVKSLERLYAILTDRQGLEDLEKSLKSLQEIKTEIAALADRESELRERTSALERDAAGPEQRRLQEAIENALARQRSLLGRTEARARQSGEMEIEAIARELEALAERQETDASVLESWKPEERGALDAAATPLGVAAERASLAQRLAQAARELRAAAAVARDPEGDLAAAERELDAAADREERREKAARAEGAGENAAQASKALHAGARALADAPASPSGRENAARSAEEQAEALERAAEEALAAARAEREAARTALAELAVGKSATAGVAQRALTALPDASPASGSKAGALSAPGTQANDGRPVGERAESELRAAAEARRALAAGLEDQDTLPSALAASQGRAAEDAERLARALGARPEGQSVPGSAARRQLEAAAQAQRQAAASAAKGAADESAPAARSAVQRLNSAREELARAREESRAAAARNEEEQALAREQEELARSIESLGDPAGATSPAPGSQEAQDSSGSEGAQGAKGSESTPGSQSSEGSQGSQQAKGSQGSKGRPGSQGYRGSEGSPSRETREGSESGESASQEPGGLPGAQRSMQSAAQSLEKGAAASAAEQQREAIDKLEQALEATRESAPLTRPEDLARAQELAAEQERIRKELLDLARRNEQRETARPAPSLAQAGASASKAEEALEDGELGDAQSAEQNAERQMRDALNQLSEEEEQYQKLRAEELLFKIAEQVKGLLDGHRDQMRETIQIDAGRKPGVAASHTQRLRLRKVSKAEEGLATRAREVELAIRAEESLVFAEVLDEAARDLSRLARDLGEEGGYQSGERVRALQEDVEEGLDWLHQALQMEKERRRQEDSNPGQSGGQQQGRNRLVPDAAELKLLRQLEVENLDALEKFKAAHPELLAGSQEGVEADPRVLEDLGRLANRHQRMSDLFGKFRKRLGLPDPEAEEP